MVMDAIDIIVTALLGLDLLLGAPRTPQAQDRLCSVPNRL